MKKLLIGLVMLATATSAFADRDDFRGGYRGGYGHYENHYHGGGRGGDWIAPLIIGGVAGYVLAQPRQQTVIVQQPPYQPLPSYVPATEPIYQYQAIYDANCNCYQRVLVQIN